MDFFVKIIYSFYAGLDIPLICMHLVQAKLESNHMSDQITK